MVKTATGLSDPPDQTAANDGDKVSARERTMTKRPFREERAPKHLPDDDNLSNPGKVVETKANVEEDFLG